MQHFNKRKNSKYNWFEIMKKALGYVLLATILATPAMAELTGNKIVPTDEIKFENAAQRGSFINIENGPLVVTPIHDEAWSSRWYLEPADDGFVRIRNRWKDCYLHLEYGQLECGNMESHWWSAQWVVQLYETSLGGLPSRHTTIKNRWTDCLLTNDNNNLTCVNDKRGKQQVWKKVNLSYDARIAAWKARKSTDVHAVFLSTDGGSADASRENEGEHRDFTQMNFYNGSEMNDDIEVVKVAPYTRVELFEHIDFTGRRITLTCGEWELIGDPENEASSAKIVYDDRDLDCRYDRRERHNWD
jgi:hypothetical protein